MVDTSKFECFRSKADGSIYYGKLAFMDRVTKQLVPESEVAKVAAMPAADFQINYEKVRHGYGLQIYNGQRNNDGILTKYEGNWHMNKRHGNGFAMYADGSSYKGQFKNE